MRMPRRTRATSASGMTPASTARWTYSSARRIPSDETPADSGGPGVSDDCVIADSMTASLLTDARSCRRGGGGSGQLQLRDRRFAQLELLDLAGHRHREGVDELPVAGDL